ncbi:MAG: response regulator [Lachnospiraceae bacterium]|nr:response regulator [Lachnospiraceae bacterium]
MFRILIADDEGIMRESIRNTIQSNFASDCEIQTVRTGREVVEQCATFRPDIAFVDIQMPGLSGIQAIQEVRKTDPSILFIIITAYDRFSYAQEAVNLGVMEYITKPVNKKKIVDVCVRAMHQVEEMRRKRSDDLRVREKLEIVQPMIEVAFINNLLQEDRGGTMRDYLDMLDIQEDYGFFCVLEFGDGDSSGNFTNAVGSNVKMNQSYQELKNTVRDYLDCIVGPLMGNRIPLFIASVQDRMPYEQRVEMITRVRSLLRRLESDHELSFRSGIGDVHSIEEASASFKEAVRCLRQGEGHVVHIMDLSAAAKTSEEYPYALEQKFIQHGMMADAESACACAEELLEWTQQHNPDELAMRALTLVIHLQQKAMENGLMQSGQELKGASLMELSDASGAQVQQWLSGKIRTICEDISSRKQRESENVVSRAAAYIREHYAEEITLDEVSRLVDISPYYFSKLFKQETGENFIEYLTYIRIEKAKEYLANPRYSIKEVCIMCGYSDPNYFSRIFKKYVGKTPSEYRGA